MSRSRHQRLQVTPSIHGVIRTALVLFSMYGVDAQNDCLSLQSSTACPAFSAYYISLATIQQYDYFVNVTNVASFDHQMKTYIAFVNDQLDCAVSGVIDAQYSMTYLCARMIQDATRSLPCNYQHQVAPPPLCQSTCMQWVSSIQNNSLAAQCNLASVTNECVTWPGLSGSAGQCISGSDNEPNTCGFRNHDDACDYCKTSTDSCCSKLDACRTGLSIATIAGIAAGSAVCLVLVALAVFIIRRRRQQRQPKQKTAPLFLHRREPSQEALMDLQDLSPRTDVYASSISLEKQPSEATYTLVESYYDVVQDYTPRQPDELQLVTGTSLFIKLAFDDGWAYGYTADHWQGGLFPLFCVVPSGQSGGEPRDDKTLVEECQTDNMMPFANSTRSDAFHLPSRTPTLHRGQAIPKRTVSKLWTARMSTQKYQISDQSQPRIPTASYAATRGVWHTRNSSTTAHSPWFSPSGTEHLTGGS